MRLSMALFCVLACGAIAAIPSTQPVDIAATELHAKQAFTRGEYATALPLLQKVAENYKSQPDKLGPIQEQINVCVKAIAAASSPPAQALSPEMSPETRKPHPAPKPGEVINLTIKELGNFEYDAERGGN